MRGLIDIERKRCESIGCYTYYMAFGADLDLGISRWNFGNAVSQEWEGRLTWNERDVSWIWCCIHNGVDLGPRCMANRSMWNSYCFQPVGKWMGYSFTDLGPERPNHYLNQWCLVYWCIYASLGLNGLRVNHKDSYMKSTAMALHNNVK